MNTIIIYYYNYNYNISVGSKEPDMASHSRYHYGGHFENLPNYE